MKKITIARPGYPYIIAALALGTVFLVVFPPPALLFFSLALFFGYFFRDPERLSPLTRDSIVSPADGRILKIEKISEPQFMQAEAWKISIFLSIFDVHINRSPYAGSILYSRYIPGKFRAAYRDDVSSGNERNLIGLQTEHGKLLVVQIAGMLARRIVCWIKTGDTVERGARIGMIRFGSCTELYLPLHANIKVKEGERVRGGETIMGEFAKSYTKKCS
ncbi:MAG: phosphatidylserine decarboxylase family protein [Bacillota bacterium]